MLTLNLIHTTKKRGKIGMYSELECGVCYQTYNASSRCPRELQCEHTFCESCLRALTRPLEAGEARLGADRFICCPLCREQTLLSGDGNLRAELRVDESTLEQMMTAGVLDNEEEEEPEEAGQVQEADVTKSPPEESEHLPGVTNGRLRRSLKKVWRAIIGKKPQQGGDECITSDELRSMAMMSCYMF